jgi:hypothetical protein
MLVTPVTRRVVVVMVAAAVSPVAPVAPEARLDGRAGLAVVRAATAGSHLVSAKLFNLDAVFLAD